MRISSLLFVAFAIAITACSSDKGEASKSGRADGIDGTSSLDNVSYTFDKVTYQDSLIEGRSRADAECTIQYLTADNTSPLLVGSVDKWIRKMMPYKSEGDNVGMPLAKYVVKTSLDSCAVELQEWSDATNFPNMSYEYNYKVTKLADTPTYLTMLFTSYVYMGGAHGGASAIGQTFVTEDGHPLGLDMFRKDSHQAVLQLVKQGLMKYFKVSSDKELEEQLLLNGEPLPFPQMPPYFVENGVCFLYQQYEIAPYSEGMPECTIPFEEMMPYFTKEVRNLFPQDDC